VIVRTVDDGLELITQPDHAHLAHAIMKRCVSLANRPRRNAILLAIREHDNGWTEEDAAPAVNPDTGAIFDFVTAPLSVRHSVWPRGIKRLAATPWAAALVAQHAITVYDRFRSDDAWTPFFDEMMAMRDTILREMAGSLDDLVPDYAFVRLADLISLTFCTGWTDAQRFAEWTVRRSGERIVVTPDAFGGVTVPFTIEARRLSKRVFQSDANLRDALASAPITTLRGEVG
jgi:hypothetical protein